MCQQAPSAAFVAQIQQQLDILQGGEYSYYSTLYVYVAGVSDPWEIGPEDEYEFNQEAGFLIVRGGPTDYWENAGVPENVIRLSAIVATMLGE
jgi:hypothetical protein